MSDRSRTIKENISASSFLFLAAFLPRAFGLNVFITPDEYLWIERSGEFLAALLRADWAATFQVGHPGLTTRWTGVLGILATYLPRLQMVSGQLMVDGRPFQDLLADLSAHLPEVLAATRYPTAILTSLGVVGLYFLVRTLFGQRAALLSAVILTWDPFYLALSRVIHHDALSTTFMVLSLLGFMVHLKSTTALCHSEERSRACPESRREESHFSPLYLIFSGLMAGLAFLSKSPTLFLVPFTALLSLGTQVAPAGLQIQRQGGGLQIRRKQKREGRLWPLDWRRVAERGRDWVAWGLMAALIFALLWPAVWVDPLGTIQGVMDKATGYAASPHERGNFFLGRVGMDPGPLFYPVALLFRLTPLTLLGLGSSLLLFSKGRSSSPQSHGGEGKARGRWHIVQVASLWAFIILYVLFMTTGAKKFDRYLLPIFPVIDILAALGLLALGEVVWERMKRCLRGALRFRTSVLGLGLVVLLQGGFALPQYPYYLTYYNPLLGGIRQAAQIMLVGWGEGYEQAARYLNQKDDAAHLKVATWYAKQCIGPFFNGQSYKLNVSGQEPIGVVPWYDTDYVVSYINQVQREIPTTAVVSFFRSQQPEYVVHIKGLDYAAVYKVPPEAPPEAYPYGHVSMVDFGKQVRLLGWEVEEELAELEGLHYLVITLYWQSLQPITENYRVYLKLVDGDRQVWRQDDSNPIFGFFLTSQWEEGVILRDKHGLEVPHDAPAGVYYVGLDLFDPELGKGLKPAGDGAFLLGPIQIDERRRVSSE